MERQRGPMVSTLGACVRGFTRVDVYVRVDSSRGRENTCEGAPLLQHSIRIPE